MKTGFVRWAEQLIEQFADIAEQHGSVHLGDGLILCSTKKWGEDATENGKPADFSVPFILEYEQEHFGFECADVSSIIACLDLFYGDLPESEKREQGAKVIPFPAGGSA